MNGDNDSRIWQGLRAHLDDVGQMAPRPDLTAVRERSVHASRTAPVLPVAGTAVAFALAVFVAGQVGLLPRVGTATSSAGTSTDPLRQEAQAALDRWDNAVAGGQSGGVAITSDLTGQLGNWEPALGDNNKMAVMSGAVEAPNGVSKAVPPPGEVMWADGTSKTVALLSADEALNQLVASAGSKCPDCQPVEITAASLATTSVETSRGPATVPIWEFSVAGSAVKVTRVAVAQQISATPPVWDANNPPVGISIEAAVGTPQSNQLIVSFTGAPDGAGQPCGADYTTEAVESDLAVVVIVIVHLNPTPGACRLMGARRSAAVTLSAPLGNRVLLEVKEGLPVPVNAP